MNRAELFIDFLIFCVQNQTYGLRVEILLMLLSSPTFLYYMLIKKSRQEGESVKIYL